MLLKKQSFEDLFCSAEHFKNRNDIWPLLYSIALNESSVSQKRCTKQAAQDLLVPLYLEHWMLPNSSGKLPS